MGVHSEVRHGSRRVFGKLFSGLVASLGYGWGDSEAHRDLSGVKRLGESGSRARTKGRVQRRLCKASP